MKRTFQTSENTINKRHQHNSKIESAPAELTEEFLAQADKSFSNDPVNAMARNAVATVGPLNAAIDTNQVNKESHIFLNSVKPIHLRATNQQNL